MKLNLHCVAPESIRSDCQNYVANQISKDFITTDELYLLEGLIENTIDEIIVNPGGMEYIPKSQLWITLDRWKKLLKSDGFLKIEFAELMIVMNDVVYGRLELQTFEDLVRPYKSFYSLKMMKDILIQCGFQIILCFIDDQKGYIECQKKN